MEGGKECLERHRVVVRIEGHLVIVVAELPADLEVGVPPQRLAHVPVITEMMEEVVTLEHFVMLDDPVDLRPHIGLEDRRAEFRVIVRRKEVADIVKQGGNDEFIIIIAPVVSGPACCLEAVFVAVDRVDRIR